MRVLVAGRHAKALATTAGAFSTDLQITTAATRAASFALLERTEFDLIIACETLGDGSGLEVLRHVAVNTPNTLRIFAARPSTLNLLKGELGLFGLFRTLPYPVDFRKLWAAMNLARSCGIASSRHPMQRAARRDVNTAASSTAAPQQVVSPQPAVAPCAGAAASACPPARIPETEAFKRALAKRNAARLQANSNISADDLMHAAERSRASNSRRKPATANHSLVHLAQLATAHRITAGPRRALDGKKRTALFVGSGVFAAATAAVLTFFVVNANNSIVQSPLPLVASINRPGAARVLPWQPPQAAHSSTPERFIGNETSPAAAADLDAQAEAASETFEIGPGHPGPPQPNPPPPSAEPPSLESPAAPPENE